jgi:hypothetical protein
MRAPPDALQLGRPCLHSPSLVFEVTVSLANPANAPEHHLPLPSHVPTLCVKACLHDRPLVNDEVVFSSTAPLRALSMQIARLIV